MPTLRDVLIAGLMASPAYADSASFMSGDALYSICTDNDVGAYAQCIGYLEGVTDAMSHGETIFGWRSCVSVNRPISPNQIRDVIVRYLYDNPAKRQYTGASLIGAALQESFPCGN
jgi:Rap1a immunity proteins